MTLTDFIAVIAIAVQIFFGAIGIAALIYLYWPMGKRRGR